MAEYKYAFKTTEHMARAVARDVAISYKTATEVSRFIRGKSLIRAREELERVAEKKMPVPHVRYNSGISHQAGRIRGSYPVKCAQTFIDLLDSVLANAQAKGLATNKLRIVHVCAHKAACPLRGGRWRGREMKRSHVEIAIDESVAPTTKRSKRTNVRNTRLRSSTTPPTHIQSAQSEQSGGTSSASRTERAEGAV